MRRRRNFDLVRLAAGVLAFWLTLAAARGNPALEAEVHVQGKHIVALNTMVLKMHDRQRAMDERLARLERMRDEIAQLNEQMSEMRAHLASVQNDIQGIANEFQTYRGDYRKWARIDAVGEKIPSLVSSKGRTYEDVVIRRVTDAGLEIHHAGGSARLRYDELPRGIAERFQWDREQAEAVLAKEEKNDLLRERLHLLARQQAEQKKAEAARHAATEKRIEDLERRLAATAAVASSSSRLQSSGALGERRTVGRGSSRYYPYDRRYGRHYSRPTVYYYPTQHRVVTPRRVITRQSASTRAIRRTWPSVRSTRTIRPPMRCPNGRD